VTPGPAATPPLPDDEAVRALIGRAPFTRYRVAVRCPFGAPAVLENEPVDLRGRPFPTRFWLSCRALGAAISRLESAGGVGELNADAGLVSAMEEANRRHAAMHDGVNIGGSSSPSRAKCLHALAAFGLATGGNPVSDWVMRRAGADWPARCCVRGGEAGDGG
jgi:uncharacterized protein